MALTQREDLPKQVRHHKSPLAMRHRHRSHSMVLRVLRAHRNQFHLLKPLALRLSLALLDLRTCQNQNDHSELHASLRVQLLMVLKLMGLPALLDMKVNLDMNQDKLNITVVKTVVGEVI